MAIPCRPVGWETSSTVAVWMSGLAILLEPTCYYYYYYYSNSTSKQQPVAADSRPGPATGYHATPHQDLGGGTGEGRGGPRLARSRSQDISGPFMGTGPSGAHATLSSVVVSLMLAYPHSSALHPCSSRFLFDCDLLPSHGGPQLSTLQLSLLSACPSVSLLTRWAGW